MSTYKEVFQLAQDKIPTHLLHSLNGLNTVGFITDEETELLKIILIQKWLRDEHKLHVIVKPYENAYEFALWSTGKINLCDAPVTDGFLDTYEQALLEGINEAMKLIN